MKSENISTIAYSLAEIGVIISNITYNNLTHSPQQNQTSTLQGSNKFPKIKRTKPQPEGPGNKNYQEKFAEKQSCGSIAC